MPVDDDDGMISVDQLQHAVGCLRQGGIVAFPTETYYGLAVDPFNEGALQALFRLKERDPGKPILLLVSAAEQLEEVVDYVPLVYEPLIERFWPGPLTLIFPGRKNLPSLLTGGTGTIGIRISSHRSATELCRRQGGPITATSANLSGVKPAETAAEVRAMFGNRVACLLDGGRTRARNSSTVVGIRSGRLYLIRAGEIDFSHICRAVAL